MPFARTTVIPKSWSQRHVSTARGGMNATVTIGTSSGPTYDPTSDGTTTTWSTDYDGPARIQAFMRARPANAGEQQLVGRSYLVQIDSDTLARARSAGSASLRPRMRVHVTSAINDADLVGQSLWVIDVQLGSERFTRDLICSDNESDLPLAL